MLDFRFEHGRQRKRKSKIQNPKFLLCVLCVFAASGLASQARAGLAGDAAQFVQAYDSLAALLVQIDGERQALSADIGNLAKVHQDTVRFFDDRALAFAARSAKQTDRRQVRVDLGFRQAAMARAAKGTGVLAQDAASYIAAYDAWVALQQQVVLDIAGLRGALDQNDLAGLESAARAFFADNRARLQKRLQWQQDLSSMRKDLGFKATGKPLPPDKGPLAVHVQEFLNDRAAWESYGRLVGIDRNNLRAAVQGGQSLDAIAGSFLGDRHSQYLKGLELGLDLKAMRKDVGLGSSWAKELKPGALFAGSDLDKDEESGSLEETADTSGAK